MWIILNIFTVLMYSGAAFIHYGAMLRPKSNSKTYMLFVALLAVVGHAGMLYHLIDLSSGQNLTAVNLFSMVTWLVALLVLTLALFKPLEDLSILVFPLAAMSILMALAGHGHHVIHTAKDPRELIHILLSVLSFSVLALAAFQAMLLVIQQQRLRLKMNDGIWAKLPPIETMENSLFQLILLGFLLLTVLILSSIYFFHAMLWHRFFEKTVLACSAWLVFAGLLLGRKVFGWRGKTTVYCTLGGIALLLLTYLSSNMLIGIIK